MVLVVASAVVEKALAAIDNYFYSAYHLLVGALNNPNLEKIN
jgi:hypothetical protein